MTINEVSRRSSPREQHTKNDWSKIGLTVCYVTQVKQQSHITFGPKHPLHVCSRLHSQEITRKQCPKSVKKHLRKTFPFFQVNISPCCMQLNITIVCKNDHFVGDILLLNAHHGHQNHLPTAQRNLESRLGTWLSKKKTVLFPSQWSSSHPSLKKNSATPVLIFKCFVAFPRHSFLKLPAWKHRQFPPNLPRNLSSFAPAKISLQRSAWAKNFSTNWLASQWLARKERLGNPALVFFQTWMYNKDADQLYNIVVSMHMYICVCMMYI